MANDVVRRVLLEVVGETSNARRSLTALRVEAARADRQSVDIPVIVDARRAQADIDKFERKLDRLKGYTATPQIDVAIGRTEAKISLLRQQLDSIGRNNVEAKADLNATPALAKIAALRAALIDLNDQRVDPRIVIKADQARATLAEVQTDLIRAAKAIEGVDFTNPQSIKDAEGDLAEYRRALRAVQSEVTTTERAVRRWSEGLIDPGDNLNRSFKGFLGVIKQINPVIQGVSLVIFASLIPALIGLGGAAAGAAAGLLSLIPAAGAVGIALGAGLVAVVKSVGQVLDLRKRKQQALDSQTRQNAQQDDRLAAASRVVAEAQRSVRDAFQQRTAASRALATAERAAAQGIVDAQQKARETAAALRSSITDAYEAMKKAALDARDAVLGLRDAQLSVQESKLDLKDAQRALAEFARKGGKAMQDLGKKFEDVSFDPKGLKDAVRQARRAGSIGGDSADELERLTLGVERARLREEQATNNVTKAERDLKDARKTQADFAQKGIAAYKPYTDAVKANTDAQKELATVTREGIGGNAAVVAAKDQLRDANERIVESEQRVKDALRDRGDVMKGDVTGPMALYREELKKLTDGQRALYDSLDRISAPAKAFRDAIADPILKAASGVINEISGNMEGVNSWASKLGTIGAQNIRAFVDGLKSDPQNGKALKEIGDGVLESARILGGPVFRNFFQLMRNFAVATLPLVNEAFRKLGDSLGRAADRTNDWAALRERIRPLLRLASGFAGVILQAVGALVDLGRAVEPVFTPFLAFIREGIQKFRDFTNSAKGGDRIRAFFQDTLPLVKSLIGVVVRVGRVLAQAFQVVAPILKPILDVFSLLLDGISFLLELVLKIPAPIRGLLAAFIPIGGIVKGVGALVGGLGKLPGLAGIIFRLIGGAISGLVRLIAPVGGLIEGIFLGILSVATRVGAGLTLPFRLAFQALGILVKLLVGAFASGWEGIKSIFSGVGDFFSGAFDAVKEVVGAVVAYIVAAFTETWATITGIFSGVGDFFVAAFGVLKDIATTAVTAVTDAFTAGWEAIKTVFAPVGEFFKGIFDGIAGVATAAFDGVVAGVKGVINGLIDVVNFVIKGINAIPNIKTPFGTIGIPDIQEIPKLAKGGIAMKSTLANIGEAGKEAVLPLTGAVLGQIGRAIAAATPTGAARRSGGPSAAPGAAPTVVLENVYITSPPGTDPDMTNASKKLGRAVAAVL